MAVSEDDEVSIVDEVAGPSVSKVYICIMLEISIFLTCVEVIHSL